MTSTSPPPSSAPAALPYHRDLAALLTRREEGLWEWFASDKFADSASDEARLHLMKNAIRLDRETYADIYSEAEIVAEKLKISAPVTLYQGTGGAARNAMLIYMADEMAIMFEGDILTSLNAMERQALLAHEMAHYLHQSAEDGHLLLSDRLLNWICGEAGAHPAHARSLWLSRLYQEIYADRIALYVCGERDAVIALLIKVSSGLDKISVSAYLDQAKEALDMTKGTGSEGISHPEAYIRAIAIADWAEAPDKADMKLPELVQGKARLERLDLLEQEQFTDLTKTVIRRFLKFEGADTDALEAHARSFFPQLDPKDKMPDSDLSDIAGMSDDMKEYFAYVLADLATADDDLEDLALMHAFDFSKELGIADVFDKIAKKDLDLTKSKIAQIRKERAGAK